jgi:hypothetical protein
MTAKDCVLKKSNRRRGFIVTSKISPDHHRECWSYIPSKPATYTTLTLTAPISIPGSSPQNIYPRLQIRSPTPGYPETGHRVATQSPIQIQSMMLASTIARNNGVISAPSYASARTQLRRSRVQGKRVLDPNFLPRISAGSTSVLTKRLHGILPYKINPRAEERQGLSGGRVGCTIAEPFEESVVGWTYRVFTAPRLSLLMWR